MKILVLTFLIFTILPKTYSKSLNSYISLGSFTPHVAKVQTDDKGSTESFSFNLVLGFGIKYDFFDTFTFNPNFLTELPGSSDRDSNITKFNYFFNFPVGYLINNQLMVFAGPSFGVKRISSDGGSLVLSNGNSQDSFPIPNGSSSSLNLLLNLGADYTIIPELSTRLELSTYNLEDSNNRSFSYFLTIHYNFEDLFGYEI